MGDGHVDIRRKDGDEEGDQAPGGGGASRGEEEAEAAEDLCGSADLNEEEGCWKGRGHDPEVDMREEEVEAAGDEEEEREEETGDHEECLSIRSVK